jgi:serine/threonine protein kinase/peptidoglycan hydrolase-like protein with peptidoglycan-binding domain
VPEFEVEPLAGPNAEVRGVLAAGTLLRSYQLISVLGQGGFGVTYLARDTKLDREVAIKEYLPTSLALREDGTMVLPRSLDLAEEFAWGRERFLDEARTLAKLEGAPSIVRVIDFLEANGTAYTVMALIRGETLDRRLRQDGTLSPPAVERLLFPLLDGLERVHEIGFLHRDIKPANIVLDRDGAPTLIDFGAARAAMAGRTGPMTAIFTPGYAAAEQFASASQGPWTDIYGLSATLYHAITGRAPPSAFDRVLDDAYVPLSRLHPPGYAPELLAGIDAGLALRSNNRPRNVTVWRPMLRGMQAAPSSSMPTVLLPRSTAGPSSIAPPAAPERTSAPGNPVASRRHRLLWGSVASALILIGTVGYFGRTLFLGTAVQTMTAEELSWALEERRKADGLAEEKKKLEEEAARQAAADAEAKRKADEELAAAQQQRQKAEEELVRLRTDMEARRKTAEETRQKAAADAQRVLDEAAQKNKAAAEIAALRKADEEARQKAAAEAAAKQAADEETQRKAEAEAAALRQAEEAAQRKATAEADAKRKADLALAAAQAERQRAEEDARQMAEAETARRKADEEARQQAEIAAQKKAAEAETAKRKVDEEARQQAEVAAQKKAAEAAENTLGLPITERQRLQVALTSLGFDTRGNDGVFGPRSREMIAAWQKARGQPATGFVNGPQQQALLKEAIAAVAKYDAEQKKIEEEKKKVEEEAKVRAAAAAAAAAAVAAANPYPFDGPWKRDRTAKCQSAPDNISFNGLTVRDGKFSYTSVGEHHRETCSVQINPNGSFRNDECLLQMHGQINGDLLQLSYLNPSYGPCDVSARRGE